MSMAIEFKLNECKAVEAVLWLIQKGETSMYHIFKMLFEAEKFYSYNLPVPAFIRPNAFNFALLAEFI